MEWAEIIEIRSDVNDSDNYPVENMSWEDEHN